MRFIDRIRMVLSDDAALFTVPKFAHAHKGMLVIIADLKTDRIVAAFGDQIVNGKIKSVNGKQTHVVRDLLRASRFDSAIDQFLGTIAETLRVPIPRVNEFYKFIDGAVYNIAKALAPKGVPSPYMDKRGKIKGKHE